MMRKNKLGLIVIASLIACFALAFASQAQNSSNSTVESPDAIGVRIVPNPNHYSITRWYESQGFQGSPQALLVDGYDAIRDGRTVYVNAANIDQTAKAIYTNIYLISYNQDSAPKTVDILGQIISHWKFNNNLTENGTPTCSISSLNCSAASDCGQDQTCVASGVASSSCALKTAKNCLTDSDCPTSFFCNSVKAKITRDIKRIGRLEELKEALFNFKKSNGRYPTLAAGTYLSGHSISVWPSWSQNFLSDLAVAQSFLDPVNRLGACPGYDVKTCWDKDNKRFVYNPSGNSLVLPAGSQALVYSVDSQGSDYNLCATLESRETALNYHFSPNDPSSSACVLATGIISSGQATNTPPQLIEKSLTGETNQEFNGFIKVTDKENNPLTWSLTASGSWSGWSAAPILKETSNPNQKKVYASQAGAAGTYNMLLTVSDGQGGVLSTTTPIKILSSMIGIEADDEEYELDSANPLTYEFTFTSSNLNIASSSYTVVKKSGPFDLLSGLDNYTKSFSTVANNKYKVSYRGFIPTARVFSQDTDFRYTIRVTDKSGNSADKDFLIKVKVTPPLLEANCPDASRKDMSYGCLLGSSRQGNRTITYSASGLPAGLSVFEQSIIGTTTAITTGSLVTLKATDDYGVSATKTFKLRVNDYCGDGVKQSPNMEERGGLYNDGYEDCDGTDGIATSVSLDRSRQYGCLTTATSSRPYPILTNDQCIFKSPLDGGGYCGDGYCQTIYENTTNCAQDCGGTETPAAPITISGTVTDYMTSGTLSGVSIKIINLAGAAVGTGTTGTNGKYSVSLAPTIETYKIIASLTGYNDGVFSFTADVSQVIDFVLSSPAQFGVLKMQLSWGNPPASRDLDSHLTFNTTHIYYITKCDVFSGGFCNLANSTAILDRDDVNGGPLCPTGTCDFNTPSDVYFACRNNSGNTTGNTCYDDDYSKGLENTRIAIYKVGTTYKYFIYDYTRGSFGETDCNFDSAVVKVFNGGGAILKTYTATSTNQGDRCYWHIMDINATGTSTATIIPIDAYTSTQP